MPDPSAGWYHDPHDSTRLRYWNGAQWAEHFHPVPPQPAHTTPRTGAARTGKPSAWITSGQRSWFSRHKILTAVLAVVLLFTVLSTIGGALEETPEKGERSGKPEPKTWTVPKLDGLRLDKAQAELKDANPDAKTDLRDLAPRRRKIGGAEHWNVIRTVPAGGSSLDLDETLTVFLLRDREYQWFRNHPRMPEIRKRYGGYYEENLGYGDEFLQYHPTFDKIRELVLVRYPRGYETRRSKRIESVPPYRTDLKFDPSIEPRAEGQARRGLLAPRNGTDLRNTKLAWPVAGTRLRVGQLFVYYVLDEDKEWAREQAQVQDDDFDVYIDGDDDDDVNVPGWLCPTRFC
ncbi:DUF2510 domain-containing protein [Nocardioides dongkuii]|uniref:DUF2510 domain-containing protein n=1 Tax=Nocardioides dongkuii TaxID=2760089 RepID=UPI0015F9A5E9|nr:DUF2510 domain-containing protein [Nocardioides dongkuii]